MSQPTPTPPSTETLLRVDRAELGVLRGRVVLESQHSIKEWIKVLDQTWAHLSNIDISGLPNLDEGIANILAYLMGNNVDGTRSQAIQGALAKQDMPYGPNAVCLLVKFYPKKALVLLDNLAQQIGIDRLKQALEAFYENGYIDCPECVTRDDALSDRQKKYVKAACVQLSRLKLDQKIEEHKQRKAH